MKENLELKELLFKLLKAENNYLAKCKKNNSDIICNLTYKEVSLIKEFLNKHLK